MAMRNSSAPAAPTRLESEYNFGVRSSLAPSGVAGVYNFNINGAAAYSQLKVFINDIDYSPLVAPAPGYSIADDLITDEFGSASGKITIIKNPSLQLTNPITLKFYDVASNFFISSITINDDAALVATTKAQSPPIGSTYREENTGQILTSTVTPLTQTFIVPGKLAGKYNNGIFVTKITLYFRSKDNIEPISIHIRPMVNGNPSTTDIIPGSTAIKQAADINVSATTVTQGSVGPATDFNIFCKLSGDQEYAICINTNSKNYVLFSAQYGDPGYSPTWVNAMKEPYVGKLYKSQGTNIWQEEYNTGLCFDVSKALFEKGSVYFELQTENMPLTKYDGVYLDANTKSLDDVSNVSVSASIIPQTSFQSKTFEVIPIIPNFPIALNKRAAARDSGDIKLGVTIKNTDEHSSPIINKATAVLYTFKNLIDPYDDDTRNSELAASHGVAHSRYISKIVTLADGFDSTGLEVKLDINRKIGTDIDVFCRVMSPQDINRDNRIENLAWKRMPLFNENATVSAPDSIEGKKNYAGYTNQFYSETYKILETDSEATTGFSNLSYTASVGGVLTTFTTFNKFQVKIVMYSQDPTVIPVMKNLMATAVI